MVYCSIKRVRWGTMIQALELSGLVDGVLLNDTGELGDDDAGA